MFTPEATRPEYPPVPLVNVCATESENDHYPPVKDTRRGQKMFTPEATQSGNGPAKHISLHTTNRMTPDALYGRRRWRHERIGG